MKYIKKYIGIAIVLIPIIFVGILVIQSNATDKDNKISAEYAKKILTYSEGACSQDIIDGIEYRISKLPSKIVSGLYKKGIRILLSNGPVTNLPEFNSLKGNESFGYKYDDMTGICRDYNIGIRADNSYSLGVELHEIGHAVDAYLFNNASQKENFISIYNSESKNLFNAPNEQYYLVNPQEYFAQSFEYYYYDNDTKKKLKDEAPMTYKYINKLIRELKSK